MKENKFIISTARIIVTLVIALMVLTGCVKALPDVKARKTSQYKYYQNQNGVGAAIDVFFEEKRLKQYFGGDLLFYDILPILVVVENNTNQLILVEGKNISLFAADKNMGKESSSSAQGSLGARQQMGQTVGLTVVQISPIVGVGIMAIAQAHFDTLKLNISGKALQDKGIYNGESHHGFIYFPVKDMMALGDLLTVAVKVKSNENTSTFMFDIDTKSIKNRINEIKEEVKNEK